MAKYSSYSTQDDYDDYFNGTDEVMEREATTKKEDIIDTNPEKEYIDLCFIDLTDTNIFESAIARSGNIDAVIKLESSKRSNTFSSYKNYYDEVYNKMNIIEDSIMKVKLKYPHCNITTNVQDYYISLTFIL